MTYTRLKYSKHVAKLFIYIYTYMYTYIYIYYSIYIQIYIYIYIHIHKYIYVYIYIIYRYTFTTHSPISHSKVPSARQFYQQSNMILWSIRTFWYKGSAENNKKNMVAKKCISLKNSSLKFKVCFFFKKVNV